MSNLTVHNTKKSLRRMIAATLTIAYLVIALCPLASFALHSTGSAPVDIRECSGDCNLCGCSPESSASNTCCCSKKRQQQGYAHEDDEDGTPGCSKTKPVENKAVIACGCPCGSGKQDALSAGGTSEVLPCYFTEQFSPPHTETTFTNPIQHLASRHGDPPDPPPKLSIRS